MCLFQSVSANELSGPELGKIQRMRSVLVTELLAKPEKYDGQEIALEGYITNQPESDYIYLCKDYADNLISAGRIKLHVRAPGPWIRSRAAKDHQIAWKEFSFPGNGNEEGAYGMLIGTFVAPSPESEEGGTLKDVWFIYQHQGWNENDQRRKQQEHK
jgi:hypothetical protein